MWDPLDQHTPNSPLLRGAFAGLLWIVAVTGAVVTAEAPLAGLFIGPFVIVALIFSVQMAVSAYRGGGTTNDAAADPEAVAAPEDADDSALAVLRERYAQGEIDHAEFERRVNRLLDADAFLDADERARPVAVERE